MPSAYRSQKKTLDLLELKLQTVVNSCVISGSWPESWKISECSYSLISFHQPLLKKKKKTGSYYVAQTGFKLSLTSASCWDCRHVPPHQACEWLFNQENDLRPTYPDYPITERGLCASEIQQFWTFLTRLDRWLMIEVDWTPTVGLFSFNSCCLESQNCKLTGKAAGGLPFTHLTTWDGRKTGLWLTAPCLKCHFWRL